MTTEETSIRELKSQVYGLANSKQADQYTKTTKAIAEYVGRIYGHEMKVLVSLGREMPPEEPDYPADATNEKEKAIWSKKYDLCTKKSHKYGPVAPEEIAKRVSQYKKDKETSHGTVSRPAQALP